MLQVAGVNLGLADGVDHFFNLYVCDAFLNCEVTGPDYPLVIDSTPPQQPLRMLADRNRVGSADGVVQYFTHNERIDPIWVFSSFERSTARFVDASEDATASEFNRVLDARAVDDGSTIILGKLPFGEDLIDPQSGAVEAYVDLYRTQRPSKLGTARTSS